MYRVARYHPRLKVRQSWQWYLERAANTTVRLGFAKIGYMDGTVTREVLRSLEEEANATSAASLWATLAAKITRGERYRADYFSRAPNPYGSEVRAAALAAALPHHNPSRPHTLPVSSLCPPCVLPVSSLCFVPAGPTRPTHRLGFCARPPR